MNPGSKVGTAVATIAVLVAGVVLWGRLANDDRTAMLLTAGWFAVVLGAGLWLSRSRAQIRGPFFLGYVVTAVGVGVLLGLPMLSTNEVNEQVVSVDSDPGNEEVATGSFAPLSHPGSGTATVVKLANGEHKLTLTDFETDNGPDLRVYLSTEDPAAGGLGDFEDLGALKGNVGNQQYDIPGGVDVERFAAVVVWCRAFSVGFTSASLD